MSLRSTVRWLGGVLIVLLSLLFALHKNAEIQTDIWIERPTAAVWQILTGTNEYPVWNPFIRRRYGGPTALQGLTVGARHWSFDTASKENPAGNRAGRLCNLI